MTTTLRLPVIIGGPLGLAVAADGALYISLGRAVVVAR